MHPGTTARTGGGELAGVVAVTSAHHHHDRALPGQIFRRLLSVLGRLTDRVAEADLGLRETSFQVFHQLPDPGDRLCGLAHHTEQGTGFQGIDLGFVQHDVASGMILGEAADLDMLGLADDHRMASLTDQGVEGGVGAVDEGAGGFGDFESHGFQRCNASSRGAMGGDEHPAGGDIGWIRPGEDTAGAEGLDDGGVVDEFTEDGDGSGGGGEGGVADGITNTETPAEMGGAKDLHEKLCITKFKDRDRKDLFKGGKGQSAERASWTTCSR